MFDLYTDKARRVMFFARYEASHFGSPYIESEHLLLPILREDKALTNLVLRSHGPVESIRKRIEEQSVIREQFSTSVDLPLSNECKRILAYAAEEAKRLSHKYTGPEHLLLGILREDACLANRLLYAHGISLEEARTKIAAWAIDRPGVTSLESSSGSGVGSGSVRVRAATRPLPSVRFVDEAGENLLTAASILPLLPRIGETVALLVDGSPCSYRVLDIVWSFADTSTDAALAEIVIRLGQLAATA